LTRSKCAGEVIAKQVADKSEKMFFSLEGIDLFGFFDCRKMS